MRHVHATRRGLLGSGLGLVSLGATVPTFLTRTVLGAPKPAERDEPILVVVQLSGGHDGLSAVVPYGHDEYYRARKACRVEQNEVIKLNEQVGLNPNLTPFKKLLDEGKLAIIQGVGYPNPNQSHFTSMDIWHLADPTARTNNSQTQSTYGWLGRYLDKAHAANKDPKLALAVGSGRAPLAIFGKEHPGLSFQVPDAYRYVGDRGEQRRAEAYRKLNSEVMNAGDENLQFVTRTAIHANESSEAIRALASKHKSAVEYPRSSLASSLRTVAGLIAGGLSTRVYYVFHGGYDTHAGQRQRHDKLMGELSSAIAAFQGDLAAQKNDGRVLTMAFSEFGRRLDENFSDGTDHGMAGPMFLFGPRVKPGLHGKHPSLKEADLVLKRDLRFEVDFRSVYATVLERWMRTPATPVIGTQMELMDLVA